MTTPQVPANALDVSDVSDEINPAGYVQGQQDIGGNNSVRQLTGSASKTVAGSEILFSDLSNKVAFSEIIALSTSNTQGGVATEEKPITAELTLQANSDMFDPTINWSYSIDNGSQDVTTNDIIITKPTNKSAVVRLSSLSGTKVANLTVTGVMTVSGHTINTCTKNILLTVNAVNTAFQVTASPSFTVNASGVSAQTATIIVTATSNTSLAGVTYKFTPTFVSGTGALTPTINSDNIVFTSTAAVPLTNAAVYSLFTEMFQNGTRIRTNTSIVDIRAQFIDREITSLTPAALSNNQFSNSTSQYSTIDVTAVHNSVAPDYAQGTITFTLETTGDAVTQQTLSSNSSTKVERISLYHDKDVDGFGFKKATVVVVATLRSPDNIILDQKRSQPLTLRAGTYGLTINPPPSNTQVGFSAQTATSIGTATWGAGNFSWSVRQFNGSGPQLIQDNGPRAASINIRATTPSGKNATQTISNTSNYDITATLSYDGVTIVNTVLSDILIRAESQPYTFSITTPATSNVQMEVNAVTAARMVISASKSTGTITWSDDNLNVGLTPNPTSALVEVESPAAGGANTQNVVVTATLRDGSSRVIEALSTPTITLDAATSKLTIFDGDVTKVSDKKTDSATGIYETSAVIGNHKFRFPPVKKGGNDLLVVLENPQKISITATATQASNSGSYELVAEVNYKGIIRTVVDEATVTVSALAPQLNVIKYPYNYSTYSQIGGITGFGGEIAGSIGSTAYFSFTGVDLVADTDYPGTINTDYTITRVVNVLGSGEGTATITGPFYGQAANTNPAPAGFPATTGGNKRRDRVESTLLTISSLRYNITYELRDLNNNVLITNTVSSDTAVAPPTTGQVQLTFNNAGAKTFQFVDKPTNGFGYPESSPLEVYYSQNVSYTATYSSTAQIPTPRFAFSFGNQPGDNVNANRTINANTINGQANITVSSVYYDNGPSIKDSRGTNTLQVQLTSVDPNTGTLFFLGEPKSEGYNFDLPMPPGRCYRLATYSTYGVRQQHTRDPFGFSNEQIDYGRIPTSGGVNGPETKWIGFHDGSRIYEQSQRPLYGPDGTRYYSSQAHRTAHQSAFPKETRYPSKIIPTGYFMVLSFQETGSAAIGQVSLVGSDNNVYAFGSSSLWAAGSQNDTSRDNDSFEWFIYQWSFPSGVSVDYAFISNIAGVVAPPPFGGTPLTFTAVQPGNVLIGENVNLNIGTVSGGIIEEDLYIDPGSSGGGGGPGESFTNTLA